MPPTSSLEPGTPPPEPATQPTLPEVTPRAVDPDAPVSFIPHDAAGAIPGNAVRIRTGRYGELDEHELIRLLDTIEDERARGRFRESVYISCFVWLLVAWLAFYGPKYLWHAPRVVNPMDVLKERELTQLNMPILAPHAAPRPAAPPPKLDNNTLERLRTMTRERAAARPHENLPDAPTPTTRPPVTTAPNIPPPTAPTPNVRTPPPVVADAPTPQPSTRPNFNTNSGTAGDAIQQAINGAAHDHSGGGGRYYDRGPASPLKMGGAEILSDTQGVNFNPYLQRILSDIKRNWLPLIPEEAQPPLSKQGETFIRFTILPDGNIGGMHLEGSTHDDAINHSCWSAITSEGQFPPLPTQFHGPNLELRIHFLVNKQIE